MAAGLPLPDLQARIGDSITAQATGKHERNESMPNSAFQIAPADALGAPVNHPAGSSGTVLESVSFREKRFTRKREEVRIEATVLRLVERSLAVEDALGLPSMAWPVPRDPAEAEHAAREPRASWGRGASPTTGAPPHPRPIRLRLRWRRVHAHRHRVEGYIPNAAGRYRPAGKPVCESPLDEDWDEIALTPTPGYDGNTSLSGSPHSIKRTGSPLCGRSAIRWRSSLKASRSALRISFAARIGRKVKFRRENTLLLFNIFAPARICPTAFIAVFSPLVNSINAIHPTPSSRSATNK